jgi:ABC-2 type transport system ATP-binding protein
MMGLLEPDAGETKIAGELITFGDSAYKCKIGYSPETPVLYEYLTGHEFLHFIVAAKQVPKESHEGQIQQ